MYFKLLNQADSDRFATLLKNNIKNPHALRSVLALLTNFTSKEEVEKKKEQLDLYIREFDRIEQEEGFNNRLLDSGCFEHPETPTGVRSEVAMEDVEYRTIHELREAREEKKRRRQALTGISSWWDKFDDYFDDFDRQGFNKKRKDYEQHKKRRVAQGPIPIKGRTHDSDDDSVDFGPIGDETRFTGDGSQFTCADCMRKYGLDNTQCSSCGQNFCPNCSWNIFCWNKRKESHLLLQSRKPSFVAIMNSGIVTPNGKTPNGPEEVPEEVDETEGGEVDETEGEDGRRRREDRRRKREGEDGKDCNAWMDQVCSKCGGKPCILHGLEDSNLFWDAQCWKASQVPNKEIQIRMFKTITEYLGGHNQIPDCCVEAIEEDYPLQPSNKPSTTRPWPWWECM